MQLCFNRSERTTGLKDNSGWKEPQEVPSPASCEARAALRSDEVAHSFNQPALEKLQGQRLQRLSGQLVPIECLGEKFYPISTLNLFLCFNFCSLSHPPTTHPQSLFKGHGSSVPYAPTKVTSSTPCSICYTVQVCIVRGRSDLKQITNCR